ncbi:hypothetical protein PV08_07391 [Exophiala spinifera]|uniref:Rieske domain-containing protein n=1 Tax=Exophiala spinifera TaxID=91928 RepID=A0A0D1ZP80_9EURO|nr:uncharacterized protein PV08_07391 [Exophiala spinifera]KIW14607.1 hypothetical protein PV08_07391 [Exophiala spinifera]
MDSTWLRQHEWLTGVLLATGLCAVVMLGSRQVGTINVNTASSRTPRKLLSELDEHTPGEVAKVPDLPEGYWTSRSHFNLEKRAIFVKVPVAVAHASEFDSPGQYRVIDHPAGLPLVLVLGKDRVLRCFHNVCRHRAYPVVSTRREGRTPLLSCGYHGWTYDLKGQLIKAPKFDDVEGFERDNIRLHQVYTWVDSEGIVLVDLSRNAAVDNDALVSEGRYRNQRVERWQVPGKFNWKMTEFEDAFSPLSLDAANASSIVERVLGKRLVRLFQTRQVDYSQPSMLSALFVERNGSTRLFISISPTEVDRCVVSCTLITPPFTPSTSSKPEDVIGAVKSEISTSVSYLEKTYRQIAASDNW